MTLRQTIQAAPVKTTDLMTKLSATSNQAVKTRENLLQNSAMNSPAMSRSRSGNFCRCSGSIPTSRGSRRMP